MARRHSWLQTPKDRGRERDEKRDRVTEREREREGGGVKMVKIEWGGVAREVSRHHRRRREGGGADGYFPVMPFASVRPP